MSSREGVATVVGGSTAIGARRSIEDPLSAARLALGMDLTFLSHIRGDEQEFAFVANPAAALELMAGSTVPVESAYCGVMLRGGGPERGP